MIYPVLALAYLLPLIGVATWLSSASHLGTRQWLKVVGAGLVWPVMLVALPIGVVRLMRDLVRIEDEA